MAKVPNGEENLPTI